LGLANLRIFLPLLTEVAHNNRVILPGLPHYVTERGRKGDPSVFREPTDYRVFLHLLEEACTRYEVAIWGYTLLARSYSLILVPDQAASLDAAMRHLDAEYARYHNLRHMVRGSVWEGGYKTVPMCWSQVWDALVLAERQPIHEERLSAAWAHPWSSAAARLGRAPRAPWLAWREWELHWTSAQWMNRLQRFENEEQLSRELAEASLSGQSLGTVLAESIPRIGPRRAIVARKGLRVIAAG